MNVTEIQKRVDALSKAMQAKGLREAKAEFQFESFVEPYIWLNWKDATRPDRSSSFDTQFKRIKGSFPECFDAADEFVAGLPSADETRLKDFMGALGRVIDLGREHGIEVGFVNPLVETMKKLSENVLTFRREHDLTIPGERG